jgi:hypothetical protein
MGRTIYGIFMMLLGVFLTLAGLTVASAILIKP